MNWDIAGHENIIKFLQNGIAKKQLAHAYLFTGPKHVGKHAVASQFIQRLLCEKKDGNICNSCAHCQKNTKNAHPDVFQLQKEPEKRNIGIEQVRTLEQQLSLSSFSGSYKIGLLQDADALSIEAGNSLLKTLEEPTGDTILILLAENREMILPTILSRCQILQFYPVKKDTINNYLENKGATRSQASDLSSICLGKPGIAIKYYQDDISYSAYQNSVKILTDIIGQEIGKKFKIVSNFFTPTSKNKSPELINLLHVWTRALRDILLIQNGQPEKIANIFTRDRLQTFAKNYQQARVLQWIDTINNSKQYLQNNAQTRLVFENIVLSCSDARKMSSVSLFFDTSKILSYHFRMFGKCRL